MSEDQPELFELDGAEAELLASVGLLIDPEQRYRWPEQLAGMLDVGSAALRADGAAPTEAMRLAGRVVIALARYMGGRQFYLPNGDDLVRAVRDRELFHAWQTGTAPETLASQYGVTYQHIMRILAEQRALWRRKHEPRLPGI